MLSVVILCSHATGTWVISVPGFNERTDSRDRGLESWLRCPKLTSLLHLTVCNVSAMTDSLLYYVACYIYCICWYTDRSKEEAHIDRNDIIHDFKMIILWDVLIICAFCRLLKQLAVQEGHLGCFYFCAIIKKLLTVLVYLLKHFVGLCFIILLMLNSSWNKFYSKWYSS